MGALLHSQPGRAVEAINRVDIVVGYMLRILFCRDVGLFCKDTGLFSRDVGLFCRDTGLFCIYDIYMYTFIQIHSSAIC